MFEVGDNVVFMKKEQYAANGRTFAKEYEYNAEVIPHKKKQNPKMVHIQIQGTKFTRYARPEQLRKAE